VNVTYRILRSIQEQIKVLDMQRHIPKFIEKESCREVEREQKEEIMFAGDEIENLGK
jgi:hypothetical protein